MERSLRVSGSIIRPWAFSDLMKGISMICNKDFAWQTRPWLFLLLVVLGGYGLKVQAAGPEPAGWYCVKGVSHYAEVVIMRRLILVIGSGVFTLAAN